MGKSVIACANPEELSSRWDELAGCCYMRKEFLSYLHKYNYCFQVYYQLFENELLVAGTITYTVKTNLLTFLNVPTPVSFRVIGLPVSIASPPVFGNQQDVDYMLDYILKEERGLILGLNFLVDHLPGKVVNMRTLPTIVLNLPFTSMDQYCKSLRHPYRRRLHRINEKFEGVESLTTTCSSFNEEHYDLYLQVMKASTTKLEILKADVFRYLPGNFELTTLYAGDKMLFWYILCRDTTKLYYFMCGMNYKYRDTYQIYQNSLFSIAGAAMAMQYSVIDLGQTAEIAKMRIGGLPSERKMFMYHRNPVIHSLIRLFKPFITYKTVHQKANVFKQKEHNEDPISKTGTFA